MIESTFMSSIALTARSRLRKGKDIGVKDIREKYGKKMASVSDDAIQGVINKMKDKIDSKNDHIKTEEVVMTKPVFDKDDIKNAVEDCLKSGKCDPFNTLSNNVDLQKKGLDDIKSSVEEGCSKLSGIDDLKNKIDKQNDAIAELNKSKDIKKDDSEVNKLAVEALKTFSVIRNKESELTDGIKSLIDINKSAVKEKENKVPVENKNKVSVNTKEPIKNNEDKFITLDEALKHKEFGVHIIKKILDNKEIKDRLTDILRKGDKVKDDISEEDKSIIQDNVNKMKNVVDEGEKIIDKIRKDKGINILRKLMGKK